MRPAKLSCSRSTLSEILIQKFMNLLWSKWGLFVIFIETQMIINKSRLRSYLWKTKRYLAVSIPCCAESSRRRTNSTSRSPRLRRTSRRWTSRPWSAKISWRRLIEILFNFNKTCSLKSHIWSMNWQVPKHRSIHEFHLKVLQISTISTGSATFSTRLSLSSKIQDTRISKTTSLDFNNFYRQIRRKMSTKTPSPITFLLSKISRRWNNKKHRSRKKWATRWKAISNTATNIPRKLQKAIQMSEYKNRHYTPLTCLVLNKMRGEIVPCLQLLLLTKPCLNKFTKDVCPSKKLPRPIQSSSNFAKETRSKLWSSCQNTKAPTCPTA